MRREKAVPVRGGLAQLRTRIFQPLRLMISEVTQRPRPVPVSPLVVTKGSKIVGRTPGGIPVPVSAMVSRRCGWLPLNCL